MKQYLSTLLILTVGLCTACDGKGKTASTKESAGAPKQATAPIDSSPDLLDKAPEEDELTKLSHDLKSQATKIKTDLKAKADATPPSAIAIASYANIMADEGEDSEAREYVSRLKKLDPASHAAAALEQYLAEKAGARDDKARREVRVAHMKRYIAAVQTDAESAMTTDQRLALATFGEASKRGDGAVMEAAQQFNSKQVSELKKKYNICAGQLFDPTSKASQEEMNLQMQLFTLERKSGQDGVMAALPKLLEDHPKSAVVYSVFLRHRLDRDEFAEAHALVKKARAALPDGVEFRIIEDSLDEIVEAKSTEAIQSKKFNLTITLATLASAQMECLNTTK